MRYIFVAGSLRGIFVVVVVVVVVVAVLHS
jgi:hypothetical protein